MLIPSEKNLRHETAHGGPRPEIDGGARSILQRVARRLSAEEISRHEHLLQNQSLHRRTSSRDHL